MKNLVTKDRKLRFESIKVSTELCKSIFSLVEILIFYDKLLEENRSLLDENKIYCLEFTKQVFANEKGQSFLRNLKFCDVIRPLPPNFNPVLDKYKENKSEVEKIIEEWENIKSIYDVISKVMQDCEIFFELENFKDKKFVVISHENYTTIKNILIDCIKILEESQAKNESFKYSNKTLTKLVQFKNNISELYELILKLENCQIRLENNMSKATFIQKNQDLFVKLKQAEQFYKQVIDVIIDKPNVVSMLKVRDAINDIMNSLIAILDELPHNSV